MSDADQALQKIKKEHYALQKKQQQSTREINDLRKELDAMKEENQRLKQKLPETQRNPLTNEFWSILRQNVRDNNVDYIKQLINDRKLDMMDKDSKGMTLLLIAAKIGSYDIVQLCINLDADIDTISKSGQTALDLARQGAWTHIERLLLFSKMNANMGDSILNTAHTINKQKGIIENILKQLNIYVKRKKIFKDTVIDLMISILESKLTFSDDLLNLAWEFSCGDTYHLNKPNDIRNSAKITNPLSTKLWKSIKKTCAEVIQHGTKRDWYWFKQFILPSTIWFKDISGFSRQLTIDSNIDDIKNDLNTNEQKMNAKTKVNYLYYELLNLVNNEAGTDLNELENDLNKQKQHNNNDWNTLVNWGLDNISKDIVRQDRIPNGVIGQHTFEELTHQAGVASAGFDIFAHYDLNQYLPELILLAHIVDDGFQHSVCKIFDIDKQTHSGIIMDDEKTNGEVRYARGPIKLAVRAKAKSANDYSNEEYPTSAMVLDFNRCALIFDDIPTLIKALNIFVNKVRYYQSGNIIDIVRVKNGFQQYIKRSQYADIKLNVLIKGSRRNIVGEVQFLLQRMLDFKKKAHNLYGIQRQEEYIESSVQNILPLLMDDKKELFVAGNKGDIKGLLRLMVMNNKNDSDLMVIDDESKETILTNICALNQVKTLKFLSDKSVVRRNKLIHALFLSNRYNSNPIEAALHRMSLPLVKIIFNIPAVIKIYQTNNSYLHRLFYTMYRSDNYHNKIVEYILNQLKLSTQTLKTILDFVYPIKTDSVAVNKKAALKFVNKMIPEIISLTGDVEAVRNFCKAVGEKVFMNYIVTKTDNSDVTTLEYCLVVQGKKNRKRDLSQVIKYFLSHSFVIDAMRQDITRLYRMFYWIFSSFNTDIFEFILKALELKKNKDMFLKILQFELKSNTNAKPSRYNETLLVLAIKMNHIQICQTIFEIIGKETFVKLLFKSDKYNVNPWEWSIIKSSLDTIKCICFLININSVKQYIKDANNKDILFRTVFWMLSRYRENVFEYIKNALEITDKTFTELVSYKPSKPPKGKFDAKARDYWDKGLIVVALTSYDIVIVQQLADIINPNDFANQVFTPNKKNLNILEFLIQKNKFEMVQYLIKLPKIQNILNDKNESLFRVVYWMLRKYDPQICDLIVNTLQLNKQTFTKLLNFQIKRDYTEYDEKKEEDDNQAVNKYQYEIYNFVQASIASSVDCMQRLLSYIDEDLFVNKLFQINEFNVNGIEVAVKNIEKLKLIFSLKGVFDMLQKDKLMKYRLICYGAQYANDECFNYMLQQLNINDNVFLQLLLFNYPKQQFDSQKFSTVDDVKTYHDKGLLFWIVMSLNKERILNILRLIKKNELLSYLMKKNLQEITPFGYIVGKKQFEIATVILKMMDKNDKLILLKSTIETVGGDEDLKKQMQQLVDAYV